MTTATAIPATVDALLTILRAAAPDDVQIYDGLWPTDDAPRKYLMVGVSDPSDDSLVDAASSSQSWPVLGHVQRNEAFSVQCVAVAWDGSNGMATCRSNATAVLNLALAAIVADPTLGGVVLQTTAVSGISLRQGYDDDGVLVNIPFTIECQARLA